MKRSIRHGAFLESDNVGVAQILQNLHLAFKGFPHLRVQLRPRTDDLDRHGLAVGETLRTVYDPHRAAPEFFLEFVARDVKRI